MSPGYLFDTLDPSEAFSTPLDVPLLGRRPARFLDCEILATPESLRADIGQLIALASGDEEERLKVAVIEYARSLEERDDARPVGEEADPAWIATEHVLAEAPGLVLAALREVSRWQPGRRHRSVQQGRLSRDLPAGRRSPYPWPALAKFRR